MTASIGLRVYQLLVRRKGNDTPLGVTDPGLTKIVAKVVEAFIAAHGNVSRDDDLERSWFFEEKLPGAEGNSEGYIRYGTYGFESSFVNNKTKRENYRRKVDDTEEIPLFYEFWFPKSNGFVAFQSFQGRSCINLVLTRLKSAFEAQNPGFLLIYKKLMPSNLRGDLLQASQVKRVRLMKRNAPSDVTDRYMRGAAKAGSDLEISIIARPRDTLGTFASITNSLHRHRGAVATSEGIVFDEATAEIKIGGKFRRVAIFGISGDTGVIDLTEFVDWGLDGHPTYESIARESTEILKDFQKLISSAS